MAEISKITLPSGSTYDFKDTVAREMAAGTIHLIQGECSTALTDMATTNPITIDGESYTAVSGDATFYDNKEFVFDGTYWHEFGDLTGLGALALKDSATGSFTPAGTVSTPTFTGESMTSTGTFTPSGSVAITAGSGTANYTPAGSVSKPGVTVTPTTGTVNSITDVGTLPNLTTTVANETLTIGWSAGTLPTKGSDTTVMTGASAELDAAPTFTGTGVDLEAAFTGTEGNVSVSGTPSGTVSQPTFTGTAGSVTVS